MGLEVSLWAGVWGSAGMAEKKAVPGSRAPRPVSVDSNDDDTDDDSRDNSTSSKDDHDQRGFRIECRWRHACHNLDCHHPCAGPAARASIAPRPHIDARGATLLPLARNVVGRGVLSAGVGECANDHLRHV